jgi:DNA-binding NtrC family response regulator
MNDVRVLLIESDPSARETIRAALDEAGVKVRAVGAGPEALDAIGEPTHDAVLVSMGEGLDIDVWLHSIKQRTPGMPVLVLAEPDRVEDAVEALAVGADDYMLRPPGASEIRVRLGRILETNELGSRVAFFQDELSKKAEFTGPEVESPAMRGVLERIRRVAPMRSTVLVDRRSRSKERLLVPSCSISFCPGFSR